MSRPTLGYGPPSVESIRVERRRETELGAAAPAVAVPDGTGVPIRVTLHGVGFAMRAMPLIVEIGDQATALIAHSTDGRSITCEFPRLPAEGAVIRVGYPPDEFTELSERFTAAMLDAVEPGPEGGS